METLKKYGPWVALIALGYLAVSVLRQGSPGPPDQSIAVPRGPTIYSSPESGSYYDESQLALAGLQLQGNLADRRLRAETLATVLNYDLGLRQMQMEFDLNKLYAEQAYALNANSGMGQGTGALAYLG